MPGLAPGVFVLIAQSAHRGTGFEVCQKDRAIPAYKKITKEEIDMAHVALVTGGTRGIGAAISKALKAAGYKGRGELCGQ